LIFALSILVTDLNLPEMLRTYIQNNSLLQQLRIEELIGLILMIFTILFAGISNLYMLQTDLQDAGAFSLHLARILVSLMFVFVFFSTINSPIANKYFSMIRDFMPFLFILIIYFNIQDTIFLINPHDIHHTLVNLEGKLFGLQPTVWMEQFYHPRLTDWFAFSYINYYVMTLVLLGLLYYKGEYDNFRTLMVTMMINYYIGFICYLFFPASSPYLVIPDLFHVDIWKDTSLVSWATYSIVDMSPHRARDAFPSMHNATVLLTMVLAWNFHRKFFWVQLPLALSLPFATVYLRYHYVVDIIAALPVIALAFYLTPRLQLKWRQLQNPALSNNMGESSVKF